MWDNVSAGDSSYRHMSIHLKLSGTYTTTEEYNQSNLCFLDHFGKIKSCSAIFLMEASKRASLKVTTEYYFRSKTCQNFVFLTL